VRFAELDSQKKIIEENLPLEIRITVDEKAKTFEIMVSFSFI